MPMISTKTNVAISEEQELTLKSELGKAISILSGKSEQWLMLSLEDKCRLYFKGDNSKPIAYVEVKVFGKIDYSQSNKLTAPLLEKNTFFIPVLSQRSSASSEQGSVKYRFEVCGRTES